MNFPPFEQFQKENHHDGKSKYQARNKAYSQVASKTPKQNKAEPYIYHPNNLHEHNYTETSPINKNKAARYQPSERIYNNDNSDRVSPHNRCGKDSSPKYGYRKHDQNERTQTYGYQNKFSRTPSKYMPTNNYLDKSSFQVKDTNQNGEAIDKTLRRQAGRSNGFELKVNNISMMNDKISDLLSMVKNQKYKASSSNKKQDENYPSSHSANKYAEPSIKFYQVKDRKITDKQKGTNYHNQYSPPKKHQTPRAQGKYVDRSTRIKTTAAAYQNDNNFDMSYKYTKIRGQKYNEEDTLYRCETQNKKTNLDYITKDMMYEKRQVQPMRQTFAKQRAISVKPNRKDYQYADMKESTLAREYQRSYNIDLNTKLEEEHKVSAIYSIDALNKVGQYEYIPKFKGTLKREDKSQAAFLPLSLHYDRQYNTPSKYSTKLIEQKIQKLKDRVQDSGLKTQKMQKKYESFEKQSGKIYKRSQSSPSKNFQLKVHPVPIDRQYVVKLAFKLSTQIQIDRATKMARIAFVKRQDDDKLTHLEQDIKANGIRMKTSQIQSLVAISPEELNPDQLKVDENQYDLGALLAQAQKYWERSILGCCDLRCLKHEKFHISELDQEQKGYISMQDIASFINVFTGKSIAVKDITLIFRRMKHEDTCDYREGISYDTFMKTISR